MDVSVIREVSLIGEVAAFACAAGAIGFVAWEAVAKRRRSNQGQGPAERAGYTGPAMAGALAGAVAIAAGIQLTQPLWG